MTRRKSPLAGVKAYRVGYGRPPVKGRFKPGQSGNPRGKPKGRKNLTTLLKEELDRKITIQENGKSRAVPARQAIVKRTVIDALKGEHKARAFLFAYEPEISKSIEEARLYERNAEDENLTPQERTKRAQETYFKLVRGTGSSDC